MIFVDSGVWIDYFRGVRSAMTDRLNMLLGNELVVTGDLVLAEVLQGFATDTTFERALYVMSLPRIISVSDPDIAIAAARNYRILRAKGVTIRKTIDTLIATRCIALDVPLLYTDRDFDPFVDHLGLKSALPPIAS
ncbi:MAG: VapC toxin family PIN domain ribonuclease [Sphingobium sp.]|nr:VapC toxin family PIN domain ribonuclease [Sphingobium sp.]